VPTPSSTLTVLSQQRVAAEAPQKLTIRCALTDVFVRDVQVSVVFFYEHKLDTTALTRGLARVLGDFAPFNARLRHRNGERFIECGDTGARFSIARSDSTLTATLADLDDRARLDLVDVIDARRCWSGDPVLAIRVTQFADGHSALGVSWHHTAGDLNSVMSLMKAWSRAVTGLNYEKPLLVEDRDDYLNRTLLAADGVLPNLRYLKVTELLKLAAYILTKGRDKRRITLHFDPDELEHMRGTLQSDSGQRLSINDAVSAHVCSVLSSRDIKARDRRLSIAVDYRRRAGLPENVIGNMVTSVEVACEHGKPVAKLAADLRSGVDNFTAKYLNHHANLRYVQSHGGVAKITRFIPTAIDPFSGSLLVSNWSGAGIYDIDFGVAGPSHFVAAGSGPLPWLGVMHEGFRNRGLIVELELPRAVAARMLDEAGIREIHRYRSSPARLPDAESNPAWLS
jgi:hypothetical protein